MTEQMSVPTLSGAMSWDAQYRPLSGDVPSWIDDVATAQVELHHRDRVDVRAIRAMQEQLFRSEWAYTPSPRVGSTDSHGLSVEFEDGSLHVNIEADEAGRLSVYVLDRSREEWEGDIEDVPSGIEKWAWRLGTSRRLSIRDIA